MTTTRAKEIVQEVLRHGGRAVTVTQLELDHAILQIVCMRACRVCGSQLGQYCDARGGMHLGRLEEERLG